MGENQFGAQSPQKMGQSLSRSLLLHLLVVEAVFESVPPLVVVSRVVRRLRHVPLPLPLAAGEVGADGGEGGVRSHAVGAKDATLDYGGLEEGEGQGLGASLFTSRKSLKQNYARCCCALACFPRRMLQYKHLHDTDDISMNTSFLTEAMNSIS